MDSLSDDGNHNVTTNKPADVFAVPDPWSANPNLDINYKVKANSPALNISSDGKEAGAFGGLTPFVLHALPHIPIITSLWTTGSGSKTLPSTVTISAISN